MHGACTLKTRLVSMRIVFPPMGSKTQTISIPNSTTLFPKPTKLSDVHQTLRGRTSVLSFGINSLTVGDDFRQTVLNLCSFFATGQRIITVRRRAVNSDNDLSIGTRR